MSVRPREISLSLLKNKQCIIPLLMEEKVAPAEESDSTSSSPLNSPPSPEAVAPAIMAAAALGVEPRDIMAVDSTKCPCVVVNRVTKKRTICGRKIKADGRCGLHQGKCIQDEVPEAPIAAADLARRAEIAVQDKKEIIVEVEKKTNLCPCLIKSSKQGQQGRVCGRKIKANGRCGIHKSSCNLPVEGREEIVAVRADVDIEQKVSPRVEVTNKCQCYIKKTKKLCGRTVKANGRCGIHQNTCYDPSGNLIPKGVIPGAPPAGGAVSMAVMLPTIEEDLSEEQNVAAEEMAKELDDLFEDEVPPDDSEIARAQEESIVENSSIDVEDEAGGFDGAPPNSWRSFSVKNVDEVAARLDEDARVQKDDSETALFKAQIARFLGL